VITPPPAAAPDRPPASAARRWAQLLAGLYGYGLAVALMMRSGFGLGPWDSFHQGIHRLTGMSVGMASILGGVVIVAGTWRAGERPGVGTIANMLLIGVFLDLTMRVLPAASGTAAGALYFGGGILACGLATGLYIAAGFGRGPRDGLMVVVSERTGWPVRWVRMGIELSVLALGWLMGGTIGVGTVVYTLLIGPAVQWGMALFGVLPAPAVLRPTLALEPAEER
jgi:uncharacterized membrane protein YczE